jgi:hypothetical protein
VVSKLDVRRRWRAREPQLRGLAWEWEPMGFADASDDGTATQQAAFVDPVLRWG